MKFNVNFSSMKYKEVKEYILSIEDIENVFNNSEKENIINRLLQDKRKTIQKLGVKMSNILESKEKEIQRVRKMYDFDRSFGDFRYVAGVDEVGRGPLAGPIVAAAVLFDSKVVEDKDLILRANDSKKLSISCRKELSLIIKERALAYKIIAIDNKQIDEKGIAWCNNQVFLEACAGLTTRPDLVLSDGYRIKNYPSLNEFVIKGDTLSISIACASIIAKVYRDELMADYHEKYPNYGFDRNVGYGTQEHVLAIKKFGIIPIHRKSFLTKILE
ncbi:ribonuclease HII [Clostridium estertheticum]|uniref:Ribonuclease HII n=1 Tax=Clostridium estertheticum subsp. estertheticum TaxID=1552 RepID=A0A1J0GHZ7_9CLOT|nr:ribonuclease HII [Clostridium estertheticum]APC40939.1 ribonuclease HII [Clostridium estertheticum subsp. estertheticum]MBZ9617195.1 ribonuclease HII [Clostridium estertheticum subsp. laramiense]WAG72886.1 ribonuclease HII [Clostridium estertheticum]